MIEVIDDAIKGWEWASDMPLPDVIADALIAEAGDPDAVFRVSRKHPGTSKAIVSAIREGTLQDQVLAKFIYASHVGEGRTDDEIEVMIGRSHQSVSAARNHLVKRGYLTDSGKTRINRWGNQATVWQYTGKEVERP
jgi:hypothetical protein